MTTATVALAKRAMRLRELTPPDPREDDGGLSEIFRHESFTAGSPAEREEIMRRSSHSRYEDEQDFPWDTYFGQSLKPWVSGDVLDLGCFTGGRAVAWWERYEPSTIAGVDVNEVFVEAARRYAESRGVPAEFRVGFGEQIPWPDVSFDTILSFDVLEHVRDVPATLRECWRVLRPGGRLLAVFPSYFQPLEHHLSLVSGTPGLQYAFTGRTLIRAYREILDERGPDASWYGRTDDLAAWERGNTINGMTHHRFSRLTQDQGWQVELNPLLPIGAIGRRAARGKGRLLARVSGPLTRLPGAREVALHRITFILSKPA